MAEHDAPMGTIERAGGRVGLRFERRLPHPAATVWRALTESEHLAHWMPCDIVGERRAGAAIELPFWPAIIEQHAIDEPVVRGEIRVWDPPRVFEWTWDTDVLRFELVEDGGATVLTFTTWLGADEDTATANTAAGYQVCLDHLAARLDGRAMSPLAEAETAGWERAYADLVASAPRAG